MKELTLKEKVEQAFKHHHNAETMLLVRTGKDTVQVWIPSSIELAKKEKLAFIEIKREGHKELSDNDLNVDSVIEKAVKTVKKAAETIKKTVTKKLPKTVTPITDKK